MKSYKEFHGQQKTPQSDVSFYEEFSTIKNPIAGFNECFCNYRTENIIHNNSFGIMVSKASMDNT
jgi:hypothetical protein